MHRVLISAALMISCSATVCSGAAAEDPQLKESTATGILSQDVVRAAIKKAIPLLERGSSVSADERKCFTCHNQGLTVITLADVRKRGFVVNEDNFQRQLKHTWTHLNNGKSKYLDGKGQGGQVMTAGYALWALDAGDWPADETTSAVSHYLEVYQSERAHWTASSRRPPSSGGGFTATYVALRALSRYGTETQQEGIAARTQAVAKWVLKEQPKDTEDHVFRLRNLPYLNADTSTVNQAVSNLLAIQHGDGGWSQKSDMKPDAYATGTVLAALHDVAGLPEDHAAVQSGLQYLLNTQLDDGTWHVTTRADGFQEYYESGFPHEADQFISISATAWATLALSQGLPEVPVEQKEAKSKP